MTKVRCDMAMSIDGFVAGPNQRLDEPFGDGVDGRLHRWMFEQPEQHAGGGHLPGGGCTPVGNGAYEC